MDERRILEGGPRFLVVAACLAMGLFLGLRTCSPVPPGADRPTLQFVQGGSGCAGEGDEDRATVTTEGGDILIAGVFQTPTPCQHLIPQVSVRDDTLVVSIAAVAQPGACVFCLGRVEYDARLTGIEPGTYQVVVEHDDRSVADTEVALSGE